MKDIVKRLAVKLTGHKAMFTVAVLVILCFVQLSATNAGVLEKLIFAVLGAKAAEYAMHAVRSRSQGGGQ